MNITTLAEYINVFKIIVVDSGFQRDINDYASSLPNNQNNIDVLRNIANNVQSRLNEIHSGDLPEVLVKLLSDRATPFTSYGQEGELKELISDTEIQQAAFFQRLNKILSVLNSQIQDNINDVEIIEEFIGSYITDLEAIQAEENCAIMSILFKDKKTITVLKEFTKVISAWNRTLPLYHQIIKSSSPEDIEIVTVQNGSIDFLFNIDLDIALDLTELFKVGFKSFMAYLTYKGIVKPIVKSYNGNKQLIDSEKEREKLLLGNIGEAVRKKLLEQHKEAVKKDKAIDKNIDKKVEQVVKLVTSHIIKGNDVKLLSLPATDSEDDTEENNTHTDELRTISSQVRSAMKIIPASEMKALLEKYKDPEEDSN